MELVETATGRTDVEKREKIVSPVAGRVVQQVKQPGAEVTAGEIIAVIKTKESDAALAGAQTLLSEARTEGEKAEAKHILALAEQSQNSISLRAPFSGRIISRATNVNELVPENTEIYTIIDLSTLVFIADVPLDAAIRLHTGEHGSILFDALPSEAFPASITSIGAQADSLSQHVCVRFTFASHIQGFSLLKTDMPGFVRIITGTHPKALLAPKEAVMRNDESNSFSITTITPDSLSTTIDVNIGLSNDSMTEITSGNVHEGMPVIVRGYFGLPDSTRITAAR